MQIVADTSVFNYLILLDQLTLLPTLYGRIITPPVVLAVADGCRDCPPSPTWPARQRTADRRGEEDPMVPAIPHYDLGMLITLDSGLAILGLLMTFAGIWAMIYQIQKNTREITQQTREIAQITREVAFMIRRQYGDIDRDLQKIKELSGGQ